MKNEFKKNIIIYFERSVETKIWKNCYNSIQRENYSIYTNLTHSTILSIQNVQIHGSNYNIQVKEKNYYQYLIFFLWFFGLVEKSRTHETKLHNLY